MNPEDFIAESAVEALLQDVCKALRADVAALSAERNAVIREAHDNKQRAMAFERNAERYHKLRGLALTGGALEATVALGRFDFIATAELFDAAIDAVGDI